MASVLREYCRNVCGRVCITDALAIGSASTPARRAPVTVLPLLKLNLQQLWQCHHDGHLTCEAYQRIGIGCLQRLCFRLPHTCIGRPAGNAVPRGTVRAALASDAPPNMRGV